MKTIITFKTTPEAMQYVENKFGYLTMVSENLKTIESTFNKKGVCTIEGTTIFIDEYGLLD